MSKLEQLVRDKISRREMLARSGKATAFLTLGAIFPSEFFSRIEKKEFSAERADVFFKPIPPSDEDRLILPEGFEFKIIRKWSDKISATEDFGFNNDYVVYLPIDLHSGGSNSEDGLLFVNHEFPSPLFINNYSDDDFRLGRIKSAEEVSKEKEVCRIFDIQSEAYKRRMAVCGR
ncbi:MAG: DUF839 domain-containing protein [Ignavibacteria bacterium]|nr:DUF839 domain-containing protein [Ignavibacteria bacterium]